MTNPVPGLSEFPELQYLIDLRGAGWTLRPTVVEGEVVEVCGVRTWPGGWADAIRVRDVCEATGLRCDHTGRVVWRREGGLVEVAAGLLTLPAPGARGAPSLACGRAPHSPWAL